MVQKGKFSAATLIPHNKLKNVLFPTFGSPTIPVFTLLLGLPSRDFFVEVAAGLGGIIFYYRWFPLSNPCPGI